MHESDNAIEMSTAISLNGLPTIKSTLRSPTYIGSLDIVRTSDPFDFIPALLNRIDQRADVARHVVEEVNLGHCDWTWLDNGGLEELIKG